MRRRVRISPRKYHLDSTDQESIDKAAIDKLKPGDAIIVFTPDSKISSCCAQRIDDSLTRADTHHAISLYALEREIHVLVTKPATQLLSHHIELIEAAKRNNVVCFVEHHKRYSEPEFHDHPDGRS